MNKWNHIIDVDKSNKCNKRMMALKEENKG